MIEGCDDPVAHIIWDVVCNMNVEYAVSVGYVPPGWRGEWKYEKRTLNYLVKVNYIGDGIGNR
jgi:hypothetical protein